MSLQLLCFIPPDAHCCYFQPPTGNTCKCNASKASSPQIKPGSASSLWVSKTSFQSCARLRRSAASSELHGNLQDVFQRFPHQTHPHLGYLSFLDLPTVFPLTWASRSWIRAAFCTTTTPKINCLYFFFSCPCKIPLQITLIPHSLIKIIFLAKLALVKNTEFCYEVQSVPCLS